MQTLQQLTSTVTNLAIEEIQVMILYKDVTRQPVYGAFVCLGDAVELMGKRMARFAMSKSLEEFMVTRNPNLTRIVNIENIKTILNR